MTGNRSHEVIMATTTTTEETTAINGPDTANPDGNVSVTETDKAAEKAKVPNVNFNVNVKANYDKLVALAAQQTDEDGNPYTVHRFAKESLFASLSLTMDGEVLRRKTQAPNIADTLLAKTLGVDAVKGMTAGDRAKKEKQLSKSIANEMENNPELMAAVMAAMAKLATDANKQDSIEQAATLAK